MMTTLAIGYAKKPLDFLEKVYYHSSMNADIVIELANIRESYEQYVDEIIASWRETGFTLHPKDFFKDLDMPNGDFSYEPQELGSPYPTKDGRRYRLTSSVVSYGRERGKYWIQIKETDFRGKLSNSIFWNQAREPMDDETKPLHPIVTKIWSHLNRNGEFEKLENYELGRLIYTRSDQK